MITVIVEEKSRVSLLIENWHVKGFRVDPKDLQTAASPSVSLDLKQNQSEQLKYICKISKK